MEMILSALFLLVAGLFYLVGYAILIGLLLICFTVALPILIPIFIFRVIWFIISGGR